MYEYQEWPVVNNSYPTENPFDLVARVVFTHEESGETRTTEMFFAGPNGANQEWKFRFTGIRQGWWSFTTQCDGQDGTHQDSQLHAHSGRVQVVPNDDPQIQGFLTHVGSQFAL